MDSFVIEVVFDIVHSGHAHQKHGNEGMIYIYTAIALLNADVSSQIKEEKDLCRIVRDNIVAIGRSPDVEQTLKTSNAKTLVEVGRRLTPRQEKYLLHPLFQSLRRIKDPSPTVLDFCVDKLSFAAVGGSSSDPINGFPAAITLRHLGESGFPTEVVEALWDRIDREMTLYEVYITSFIFRSLADDETKIKLSKVVRNEVDSVRKKNATAILEMSISKSGPPHAAGRKAYKEINALLNQNPSQYVDREQVLKKFLGYQPIAPNRMTFYVPRICNVIGEIGDADPAILDYCVAHLDCFDETPLKDRPDSGFPAAQSLGRIGERGNHDQVRRAVMERTNREMSRLEVHLTAVILRGIDKDKRIRRTVKNRLRSNKAMKPIQRRNLDRMLAFYEVQARPIETRGELLRKNAKEIMELLSVETPIEK